jgi:hypothetical protein
MVASFTRSNLELREDLLSPPKFWRSANSTNFYAGPPWAISSIEILPQKALNRRVMVEVVATDTRR